MQARKIQRVYFAWLERETKKREELAKKENESEEGSIGSIGKQGITMGTLLKPIVGLKETVGKMGKFNEAGEDVSDPIIFYSPSSFHLISSHRMSF